MAQQCDCPDEAGKATCELNTQAGSISFQAQAVCPANGKKGKLVQNQTVKALLTSSLRVMRETEHYFCPDKNCAVVYYTADGKQTFTVHQVREAVYQKEPDNLEVAVCYCFQHTVGALHTGSNEQQQIILEDIRQGIAAGQCACDLRNPQGSCCLGNVSKLIKQRGA
jgi:hypothetical protein